ncbi:MAG: hypothetical protein F2587_02950 [Actinobacteria bacterium]|jgi:hypothetical protein|uniref:Unannotated protein n=1 Tax=freshwater metagenome TaxID=449393 RepID=A0A6J6H085_9ZZZZ|nr:hypothetical protein [Actinomycetota bacterium]
MPDKTPPKAPICPQCKGQMKPTAYGFRPGSSEDDPYINMGCLVGFDDAKFACPECGYQILESSTFLD